MSVEFSNYLETTYENLSKLYNKLMSLGYEFDRQDLAFHKPFSGSSKAWDWIEAKGVDVPKIVRRFSEMIGSCDFSGKAPENWKGAAYSDPIALGAFEEGFVRDEWDSWIDAGKQSFRAFPNTQFAMLISGDRVHKAGFSGGTVHMLFDGTDMPIIITNDTHETLDHYLNRCFRYQGFPGLANYPDHNWPLNIIGAGLKPLPEFPSKAA